VYRGVREKDDLVRPIQAYVAQDVACHRRQPTISAVGRQQCNSSWFACRSQQQHSTPGSRVDPQLLLNCKYPACTPRGK
jgi:hypothetical protein